MTDLLRKLDLKCIKSSLDSIVRKQPTNKKMDKRIGYISKEDIRVEDSHEKMFKIFSH
jgi:hypothetical protein